MNDLHHRGCIAVLASRLHRQRSSVSPQSEATGPVFNFITQMLCIYIYIYIYIYIVAMPGICCSLRATAIPALTLRVDMSIDGLLEVLAERTSLHCATPPHAWPPGRLPPG